MLWFVSDDACVDCCRQWPLTSDTSVTLLNQFVCSGGTLIIDSCPVCDPKQVDFKGLGLLPGLHNFSSDKHLISSQKVQQHMFVAVTSQGNIAVTSCD